MRLMETLIENRMMEPAVYPVDAIVSEQEEPLREHGHSDSIELSKNTNLLTIGWKRRSMPIHSRSRHHIEVNSPALPR